MFRSLLIVLIFVAIGVTGGCKKCGERNIKWTGGNSIVWPSSKMKHIYQQRGDFVKKNILATRAVIYEDNAIVTIPRFKHGVPFTLGTLSLTSKGCQARLRPFPDWSIQEEGDCSALQNAVDLFLDPQDILWILDVGVVNALERPIDNCPPKIVAVNLRTGKVEMSIDLSHLVTPSSRLQYVVADYSTENRPYLYITDASDRCLIIYDVSTTIGFRLSLPQHVASSCSRCDVLYTALINRLDGGKNLILSYHDGEDIFSVGTEFLQNAVCAQAIERIGIKPKDLIFLGVDDESGMYYRLGKSSDIYRIDLMDPMAHENAEMIREGKGDFLMPTQVVPDGGRMCVFESNFPDYFGGTMKFGVKHSLKPL